MKLNHLSLITVLTALLLLGTSCAKDDEPMARDKVIVKYNTTLPGYIDSRAIGKAEHANELFFWVFDDQGHELKELRQHNISIDGQGHASVQVPLTPGRKYSFAFWAQNKECTYDPNNSDNVGITYGTRRKPVYSSDDLRDAFYALEKEIQVNADGEMVERSVTLHRPLAQLNYGISPAAFQIMKDAGVDLTGAKAKVTVSKAYKKFGLLAYDPIQMNDQFVTNTVFDFAEFPDEMLTEVLVEDPVTHEKRHENFIWLSFNYLLTTVSEPSLINTSIEIETKDGQKIGPIQVDNKHVMGYRRTNIILDLLNETVFDVVIDDNFKDSDHVVDLVSYQEIAPSQLLTLNNPSGNYIVNGNGEEITVNAATSFTAGNLVLNNITLKSDGTANNVSPFQFQTKNLTLNNVKFEGAVSGSTDVVIVKGDQTNSVTVKDCEFNTQGIYNAIYIDGTPNLNSVLVDNVKFNTANRNNAITVGNTLDNAMINIQNCTFQDVSNAVRLFNRGNASGVGLNVKNCVCNKWETNSPQYAGFFIFEDLAKTADEAMANNVFGPDKVIVTVDNVTGPKGKIIFTDPKDGAYQGETANPNQAYYVYYHQGGLIPYGDGLRYPKFIFK